MPIQRPSTIRHRTSLFEDAVAIVEAEYATEISLDDIARRVASSRRQLQRAYSEVGDTTFADDPRDRRPRRLPPARPVRQGVPPPLRHVALGLPGLAAVRTPRTDGGLIDRPEGAPRTALPSVAANA
jgi:AraC-like DNA-binding protein